MNNLNIGKTIRKRRKELKITQEELAELSNLSVNYISRIERVNDQNISLKSLNAIANALNLKIEQLLKDEAPQETITASLSSQQKLFINELNRFSRHKQTEIIKSFMTLLKLLNN